MVAITVILAAVIGTFVISLGDDIGSSAPQASIDAQQLVSGDDVDPGDINEENLVRFTHQSGDTIDSGDVRFAYELSGDYASSDFEASSFDELSAGQRVHISLTDEADAVTNGDTVFSDGDSITMVFDDGSRLATLKSIDLDELTAQDP